MSEVIQVQGQYYILANASMADAGSRVLKHNDTFAVFDRHGDIRPLGFENQGVFHENTRFLSHWKLGIHGTTPRRDCSSKRGVVRNETVQSRPARLTLRCVA